MQTRLIGQSLQALVYFLKQHLPQQRGETCGRRMTAATQLLGYLGDIDTALPGAYLTGIRCGAEIYGVKYAGEPSEDLGAYLEDIFFAVGYCEASSFGIDRKGVFELCFDDLFDVALLLLDQYFVNEIHRRVFVSVEIGGEDVGEFFKAHEFTETVQALTMFTRRRVQDPAVV